MRADIQHEVSHDAKKTPMFTTFSAHTKMAADKRGQNEVFARKIIVSAYQSIKSNVEYWKIPCPDQMKFPPFRRVPKMTTSPVLNISGFCLGVNPITQKLMCFIIHIYIYTYTYIYIPHF